VGIATRNASSAPPFTPDEERYKTHTSPTPRSRLNGDRSALGDISDTGSVRDEETVPAHLEVLLLVVLGESPLLGHDNLLASRELELGAAESLDHSRDVNLLAADGDENLSDANTSDDTVGLSVSATHTGLETIRTGARQHLVDTEHVEGVSTHTHVERLLTGLSNEVLVGGDTGGFQGLRGELLVLIREHVDDVAELVDSGPLLSDIEDADLRLGDTTQVSRLDVGLVLQVAVATSGAASHFSIDQIN